MTNSIPIWSQDPILIIQAPIPRHLGGSKKQSPPPPQIVPCTTIGYFFGALKGDLLFGSSQGSGWLCTDGNARAFETLKHHTGPNLETWFSEGLWVERPENL